MADPTYQYIDPETGRVTRDAAFGTAMMRGSRSDITERQRAIQQEMQMYEQLRAAREAATSPVYDPNTGTSVMPTNTTIAPVGSALAMNADGTWGVTAAPEQTFQLLGGGVPGGAASQVGNAATAQGSQAGQAAAMQALQQLQGYTQSGLTANDRAAIQQGQLMAARNAQAQLQSLSQQAAMRGQSGSGIAASQAAQVGQMGANQAQANATNVGLAAAQRAYGATGALAGVGMGIDQQQFGQAFQRGAGADAFGQQQWSNQFQEDAAARQRRLDREANSPFNRFVGTIGQLTGVASGIGAIPGIGGSSGGSSGGGR